MEGDVYLPGYIEQEYVIGRKLFYCYESVLLLRSYKGVFTYKN